MIERKCFRCEKELEPADTGAEEQDRFSNPPSNATFWRTWGNWGSTVFDEGFPGGRQLEIYICDECLKANAGLAYAVRTEAVTKESFEKFTV